MEKIKIYVESGQVFILSGSSAITGLNTSLSTAPQPVKFPANGELTASVVNTNNIKVVTSTGQIVFNNVPFGDLVEKDGTTTFGASAVSARNDLNSTRIFGSTTIETKLGVETAKITALENATKTSTNDRGIYINDSKGTTQGHLQITDTLANLQAGATTRIALTDISTGQGSMDFNVRAGANGAQSSVTAMSIAGDSSFNNALVTFSQPVTFSSSVSGTSHLGNANLSLTGDRSLTLGGNALTIKSSNTTNHESLVIEDDGTVTIGPGSSSGAATLSLREASGNGANSVNLTVADALASNVSFTLPSADGSSGQVLTTNGSGVLSFVTVSGGGNNIGNTDLTLSESRKFIVGGYDFTINDTATSPIFLWDDSADHFEFRKPVLFTNTNGYVSGEIRLMEAPTASGAEYVGFKAPGQLTGNCIWTLPLADGTSGQVLTTNGSKTLSWSTVSGGGGGGGDVVDDTSPQLGGSLDVNGNPVVSTSNGNIELDPNGTGKVVFKGNATKGAGQFILNCETNTHGIVIKGPPHSAAASYTLTLPNDDGSSGQFLQTDGNGNLSFATASGGGGGSTSYVLASHSGRASLYWPNRYYYGSSSYGWGSDTSISTGQTSKTSLNDQYAHMGIVAPTAITNLALKSTLRNDSGSEDIEIYVMKGSRPDGDSNNITLTELFYVASGTNGGQDLHFNCDGSTSSAGISAGDQVFVGFRRVGGSNGNRYCNFSYTLYVS